MSDTSDALRRWFQQNANTRFLTSIGAGILVGLLLSEKKFSVRLENGQGIFSLTSDELGVQDYGGRMTYPAPPPFPNRFGGPNGPSEPTPPRY